MVILRNEFGKSIGGFTHYPWTSSQNGEFVNDASRRSFVFSLDLKEKFIPQQDNKLIYRDRRYGPIMGDDIGISDECNKNSSSKAYFPNVYNRAGHAKIERNQNSYQMFSGATNGYGFRVSEYEIFKVISH